MRRASLPTRNVQLPALWTDLLQQVEQINAGLLTELESCWRKLCEILEGQLRELETLTPLTREQSSVAAFQSARCCSGAVRRSPPPALR